jgi:predicted aspartyl protease
MTRNTIVNTMAAIAAIALPAAAHAETVDLDCTATRVVDRKEFINKDTFFAAARDIKPEYRRISIGDANTLTYGVGGTDAKNWTMRVTKVSPEESKELRVSAESATDQWGYTRWVNLIDNGFITIIRWPDGTYSATGGYCKLDTDQDAPPTKELRDPEAKAGPKTWSVPIERRGHGIAIDGTLNETMPVRWTLDTGASISNIPYDLAVKLNAKVIREQKFEQADGTIVTNQVILIKKLAVGNVYVADIEASVTARGTTPLLGKNFLDSFSSYEINNAQSQLTLRQ